MNRKIAGQSGGLSAAMVLATGQTREAALKAANDALALIEIRTA